MPEVTVTREEFREGLVEAQAVVKRLAHYCSSIDELLDLLESAVGTDGRGGNPAQIALMMDALVGPSPQSQPRQGNVALRPNR